MRTVLVIDDNESVTDALRALFGMHDIRTLSAAGPTEGFTILEREPVDLVIADMNFTADTTSGNEGIALFRELRARYADMPIVLLTAWIHLESAVHLIKAGAADYVSKPWDNARMLATVENLLEFAESTRERQRLQAERRLGKERLAAQYDLRGLIFESQAMHGVVEVACRVATSAVPVLITGPNGVGKERIAAILHVNSRARSGPFVAVNCGALPAELIEAELFGADAGAFTDARQARAGRFTLAHGGTLFLDEIGNLPLAGQVKLLRVLETGQYEPLGSSRTCRTEVRLLSATNADLPAMIREGRFREDLYYRLNVIEIAVPPLAERPVDILPLAEHFLGSGFVFTEDAQTALLRHPWPGNVRELRNAVERAKLLARGETVGAPDLNLPTPRWPAESTRIPRAMDSLGREAIEASLRRAAGNVTRAARSLGLSRQALYRRMEHFGIRIE